MDKPLTSRASLLTLGGLAAGALGWKSELADGRRIRTTQAPDNTRGARDVRDSSDSIYRNGGSKSLLAVGKNGAGYLGSITMGVHRS